MPTRRLWNGAIVPALGLGGWAIGGPFFRGSQAVGWGGVDDAESIAAIHYAYDAGIRFFDTAANYGAGHSELVLGEALASREDAIIATKFGHVVDPETRQATGTNVTKSYVEAVIHLSLGRLRRDRIDLLQLHLNDLPIPDAERVFDHLDRHVEQGTIGAYGWSTDHPDRVKAVAGREHFVSVQHACNLLVPASAMLAIASQESLLSINRSPLGMGLLTGKFSPDSALPADDIRSSNADWMLYFRDGQPAAVPLAALRDVGDLLQTGGRTLAQGALGWIWSQSAQTLPIPGFKTVAQVRENVGALEHGPLPASVMAEIETILTRPEEIVRGY